MFHRTVSSVVQDGSLVDQAILSGHPVFIQADYETVADSFDKSASGTRVRQQIGDHVAIGGTYIDDELSSGSYELTGVDAEIRPTKSTKLTLRVRRQQRQRLVDLRQRRRRSELHGRGIQTGLEEGSAWKAAAELDVGGWFGRPDRHEVDLYYKELDDGFFSSGNFLEQGTQKVGIHGNFAITDRDSVQLRHDREERTGATAVPGAADEKVLSSAQWRHQQQRWRLDVEYLADEVRGQRGQLAS